MEGEIVEFSRNSPVLYPLSSEPFHCLFTTPSGESCDFNSKYCEDIVQHLEVVHNIHIERSGEIADIQGYCKFYSEKGVNSGVLSSSTEEDASFRRKLSKTRLDHVLRAQEDERVDETFSRSCLFCKSVLTGKRYDYLGHMYEEHGFSVGLCYNLVFIDKFLDLLEEKLATFQCIYCEKVFKNRNVLHQHMRKKRHFTVHRLNHEYDEFYISNYALRFSSGESSTDEECQDEEWEEDEDGEDVSVEGRRTTCLFCDEVLDSVGECLDHMKEGHGFDMKDLRANHKLDLYGTVKLVNFARFKKKENRCLFCDARYESNEERLEHMRIDDHFHLPDTSAWTQMGFLIPIDEEDSLLMCWDDDEEELEYVSDVVPEEMTE